jgi:hypothetical protein
MDVDMTYGVIAGGVAAIPPPPVSEAVIFPPVTFPPVMFPSCANAGVIIDVPAAEVTNIAAVRVTAATTKIVVIIILLSMNKFISLF